MPGPMPIYQAIILGIVQGITEFLPVSSTAHLRILPRLLGWHDYGLSFDAALHTGTLLAVVTYFWRDWIDVMRPIIATLRRRPHAASHHFGRNLFWGIVIGCIPAGVAAVLLNGTIDRIESTKALDNHVMATVASALVLFALLLYMADRHGAKKKKKLAHMNFVDWVVIGIAQAMALIPGVSRSGATITAGLFRSLDRDTAARFSFLLSTPIFFGGAVLHIHEVFADGLDPGEVASSVAGMISAAAVGFVVIRFLLSYVRRHNLNVFVWYRLALGAAIALLLLLRI